MLTDRELFERGKKAVKEKNSKLKNTNVNDVRQYLGSIALVLDLRGIINYASFAIDNDTLSIDINKSNKLEETRKYFNYMKRSRNTRRAENMQYFKQALYEEIDTITKDFSDIYIEDFSFYNKFNIRSLKASGMRYYSNTYIEACALMIEALERYCKDNGKKLHVIEMNRRAVKCVYCGTELIDEQFKEGFVPTTCPYCKQNSSNLSTLTNDSIGTFASVAVQMLTELLPEGTKLTTLDVRYFDDAEYNPDFEYTRIDECSDCRDPEWL